MLATALALTSAMSLGAPSLTPPLAALSLGTFGAPDLALHLHEFAARSPAAGFSFAEGAARAASSARGAPACSGGLCQPVVSVPGYEPRYATHRSEAVVALLTRARVEPLATMAWALVSTGLRFDWSPPSFDGPNVSGHGWGSVMLRVRLRLDAQNAVYIPPRPR